MLLLVAEMFNITRFFRPPSAEAFMKTIPVLVKGLENSCCKSLFSVVLRTTTMSAGRVSLFFSRKPFTLYITCGVRHNTHGTHKQQRSQIFDMSSSQKHD